jgi:CRISPR type III-B/RAMP module-associated protein Cmr5
MKDRKEQKITTPEQRRAKQAWMVTEGLTGQNAKDFRTQCKQTSARILNSGLLPALAFLQAKAGDSDADKPGPAGQMKKCADALASWLKQFIEGKPSKTDVRSVLEKLMNADGVVLRRVQTEALAYLGWLTRLAEGRALVQDHTEGGAS